MSMTVRSRNGFTQNADNVWGHCEVPDRLYGGDYECTNKTLYRCDICKQFVCASHQKEHKSEHDESRKA